MSKPAFIWRAQKDGDLYRRGDYDHVSVAVYTKRKPDPALGDPGSFRVKCVFPKRARLSTPSTFASLKKAMNFAEDEARRINANRPPVDHRTAYENQEKAAERDIIHELVESTGLITKTRLLIDVIKQFVEMCGILLEIKMEPLKAAYQARTLHNMTSGQDPVEVVGKYLDYFVRVREVIPIETLVNKVTEQIEKDGLGHGEKRRQILLLRHFAEQREGRNCDSLDVEELKNWRLNMTCGKKTKYDRWIVLRQFIEIAYKDYGAIRKCVYERVMELDFVAKSRKLDTLLPYGIWCQMFRRCKYAADALYLAVVSDLPVRVGELKLLTWNDITKTDGFPTSIMVPAEVAKGKEGGVHDARTVIIPRRLGELLLILWRDSGPLIPGEGHLARLKNIAREIDPAFVWTDKNVMRRTCISTFVGRGGDKQYFADQAGHTLQKQKESYLRYVNPVDAGRYGNFQYPLEEFKALPYEPEPDPNGRPRKIRAGNQPSSPSSPAAEDGQARAEQSQPATL